MPNAKSPLAYAAIGSGVLFVWAGITNKSVLQTMRDLVSGNAPQQGPKWQLGSVGSASADMTTPGVGSATAVEHGLGSAPAPSGSYQAYAKQLLILHGWGNQWSAFNQLENGEGGWNPRAKNPSSGAFGFAQALGHGNANTQGTLSNMYGGYGLSDADARKANSGDGYAQLRWMMNYIKAVYGSPANALSKWLSRSPHWY